MSGIPWSADEIELLRREFAAGQGWPGRVAVATGRSYRAVTLKASVGLALARNKRWGKQAIAYLEAHYETEPIHVLALRVARSPEAVRSQLARLGLGLANPTEWYSIQRAAVFMGRPPAAVGGLVKSGKLKGTPDGFAVRILARDLRAFIIAYPGEVGPRPDVVALIQLLSSR